MKKELCAVCLLIIIFVAGLMNIHYINQLTDDLKNLVNEATNDALQGRWESAEKRGEEAVRKWGENDPYTHIVLRHGEIDQTTDSFYDLLEVIYSKDIGGVKGASQAVNAHLNSIASMEQVKFGSIF